jgi:replication fork protection complex subunit Tof1/Swi1
MRVVELLVPLTWTLDVPDHQMTAHHHKHLPYLRLSQVEYKRAILQHDSQKTIRQIIRVALPSMAEDKKERSVRDEGIIRLVLYALRNITMISLPDNMQIDGDEAEISRSTTIDVLYKQDAFQLLLAVASSMGDDFDSQDVVVLEVLFHLLKGIDPAKLFLKDVELAQTNTRELKELLRKEKAMLTGYAKSAPTRHNRFGTMMWLKRDDKISTLSGQRAISGPDRGLKYLDQAKKVNKPKYNPRNKEETGSFDFNRDTTLSSSARRHLAKFVEEFLDTSFNPLFIHLRRSIERDLNRVLESHKMQFFYLISWFLRAECARREAEAKSAKGSKESEAEGFGIVAGVMNQETFVLLSIYMQSAHANNAWNDVSAGMKCFSQIVSFCTRESVSDFLLIWIASYRSANGGIPKRLRSRDCRKHSKPTVL